MVTLGHGVGAICTHITTDQARSRSGPAIGPTATPQGGEHRLFGAPGQVPWPTARATPMRRSPPASRTARSPGRDRHGAPQPPATAAPGWPALSSVQVSHDVNRAPPCPFIDLAVSLRRPAGVTLHILSPE